MPVDLQKARIFVYKTADASDGSPEKIDCLFNPSEYSIRSGATYNEKGQNGKDEAPPQFIHGENSQLSLSLYFDSTARLSNRNNLLEKETSQPPVTNFTGPFAKLMKIDGTLHHPPVIAFVWGNLKFKGILKSLNQTFTYFGLDGRPLRAKMDLVISSIPDAQAEKENPFFSPDRSRKRPLLEGMSLWQLAYEEYEDTESWRLIAKANGLLNPLDAKAGQILRLPPLIPGKE